MTDEQMVLSLFALTPSGDICANNHHGNLRSEQAHGSIVSDKKRQVAKILEYLQVTGGSICDEVEVALNMRHQTASARMSELKNAGVIVAIGRRLTRSNRTADVYAIREVAA